MMKIRHLVKNFQVMAFILSFGFIFVPPATAFPQAEQKSTKTASTPGGNPAVDPSLSDLNLPQSELRGLIERYIVDRESLSRYYSVETSPTRRTRLNQFYTQWLGMLGQLNFDSLSRDGQIDYLLFKNHLDHELRQLEVQAKSTTEELVLIPFAQAINKLEDARRRMEWVDAAKTADLLNTLNKKIAETREAVEAGLQAEDKTHIKREPIKVRKTVANRAAETVGGLKKTLKQWFSFYNGYDPIFTWWVDEPYKSVDQSLKNYSEFLREKVVGVKADDDTTIIGNPIGREALLSELAYQMIPYTPEELVAIANKEFAWCEAEMKRASRELGYGDDWHKALGYVKTLHVDPGKQPELIKKLALEAIDFVDQHNLVTVPQLARDTWRMEMLTPKQQLASPFFLGGEVIQVSFPTNTMGHEQKLMSMRGNNVHFARATVFHELIPGHHLQGFMNERYRPYRRVFSTPFWTEGWAFYWEMLLWDMDFPKSSENRIGMLFWRMHRCARIIFSLGFHLEKMTPQECINFLVERVGHERENAAAEVRRSFMGGYGPLYQCAYMLGALQFRGLHRDLVDSGTMTNREFHDAILREHNIPVEMVRAILTKQNLTRDYSSNWKFYGPKPEDRENPK